MPGVMRHLFIRDNKIVNFNKSSFLVVLSLSLLACGQPHDNARSAAQQASESKTQIPQNPSPVITPTPELEVSFGDGLKIIPVSVNLENQNRRYEIDVVYPQIEGSKSAGILKLNERIKSLVTDEYKWPLSSPTKSDLKAYEKFPGISNTVSLSYEVPLATRELVSIYFNAYHYGIGAAHSAQHSFAVNYDLRTGRILNLRDLFKPGSKHIALVNCRRIIPMPRPTLLLRKCCLQRRRITKAGIFRKMEFISILMLALSTGARGVRRKL